ncbi:hypothetical protein ASE48_08555 [Mycobacterium sp. Root265]|uniref:hypothetical protein n=1 Tax=Mycobacterium sp. Root265 TaxID=1736504 RepID=UPI00070DE832|nr:hypothetical protein [Mycobacterium sp. Root265]KRD08605.1 hypothetical protein ASE48_08555 [Mycobacterium sp. Root265]
MPLSHIASLFDGVHFEPAEEIVDRPGWLLAQKCKFWSESDPTQQGTMLFVYRSPLMPCTHKWYQPVAAELLAAEKINILADMQVVDEGMMHGSGQSLIVGIVGHDFVGPHTVDEAVAIIADAYSTESEVA